ncbi:MAG: hypothetical protein V4726_00410 [Verrucomicrobiota bacterium]
MLDNANLTRAVPGGCVLGFLGLLAWIYAGLCGRALYLAGNLPAAEAVKNEALVRDLQVRGGVAFIVGALMVWVGWRLSLTADMSDPGNPRKPMLRF